jgi:hypothetical protein
MSAAAYLVFYFLSLILKLALVITFTALMCLFIKKRVFLYAACCAFSVALIITTICLNFFTIFSVIFYPAVIIAIGVLLFYLNRKFIEKEFI